MTHSADWVDTVIQGVRGRHPGVRDQLANKLRELLAGELAQRELTAGRRSTLARELLGLTAVGDLDEEEPG